MMGVAACLRKINPLAYVYRLIRRCVPKKIGKIAIRAILFTARHRPLQRKIVFDSLLGKGFCDEPKYLLLELLREGVDAEYIWVVQDLKAEMPAQVRKVKYNSWQAKYHYLTAKIWVDNVKCSRKPEKRPGQFYLQTWHGCWALKKIEQQVEDKLLAGYVIPAKEDAAKTDLMYINNRFFKDLYENHFWYDGPVIDAGSPCFSVLVNPPEGLAESVRARFGIEPDSKIVLYAPTFRVNRAIVNLRSLYSLDVDRLAAECAKRFGGRFTVLMRLHPNSSELARQLSGKAVDATAYPDVYELLSASDVLITDFSSTMAFMAFVRRPVFLFARDYDNYVAEERGLTYPLEKLPFSIAKDEVSLLENIRAFNEENYKKDVEAFINDIGMVDDGHGAEKICRILKRHL